MAMELARQSGKRIARVGNDEGWDAIPRSHGADGDGASRERVGNEERPVGVGAWNRDKELTGLHLAGVEGYARDIPVFPRKGDPERAGERAQAHRRPPDISEILAFLTLRPLSSLL